MDERRLETPGRQIRPDSYEIQQEQRFGELSERVTVISTAHENIKKELKEHYARKADVYWTMFKVFSTLFGIAVAFMGVAVGFGFLVTRLFG